MLFDFLLELYLLECLVLEVGRAIGNNVLFLNRNLQLVHIVYGGLQRSQFLIRNLCLVLHCEHLIPQLLSATHLLSIGCKFA